MILKILILKGLSNYFKFIFNARHVKFSLEVYYVTRISKNFWTCFLYFSDLIKIIFFWFSLWNYIFFVWSVRPLTFGEIGCFLSHYYIWKEVWELILLRLFIKIISSIQLKNLFVILLLVFVMCGSKSRCKVQHHGVVNFAVKVTIFFLKSFANFVYRIECRKWKPDIFFNSDFMSFNESVVTWSELV